ncbi:hypothetical protein [Methylomonas sp. TEB]|uniref:hypothetical protein n=1 Tax=Methylomonas sp. TEB TaxID=3398229 RepID=UPI0039F4E886
MVLGIECIGSVLIYDNLIADSLSAWIDPDDNSLHIKVTGTKKSLYIYPFTPQMITQGAGYRTFDYVLSGTKIGFWNEGPNGHPGDCEYDQWELKKVEIHIEYLSTQINIIIQGVNEVGSSTYIGKPDTNKPLPIPAFSFYLRFSVSKNQLKKFLAIEERLYDSFELALNQS